MLFLLVLLSYCCLVFGLRHASSTVYTDLQSRSRYTDLSLPQTSLDDWIYWRMFIRTTSRYAHNEFCSLVPASNHIVVSFRKVRDNNCWTQGNFFCFVWSSWLDVILNSNIWPYLQVVIGFDRIMSVCSFRTSLIWLSLVACRSSTGWQITIIHAR